MPARPFTRAQAAQNATFLAALADTGNARLAARHCGLNRSMLTKRRNETSEQYGFRLGLMWRAEQRRASEDRAVARAIEFEGKRDWRLPGEPAVPAPLPPLDQVTGWSKKDPAKVPHNPGVPLFGGWRLKDWVKREGRG